MTHSVLSTNNVAVITGGASGIGLAAAMRFAKLGMKVCVADVGTDRLEEAAGHAVRRFSHRFSGADAILLIARTR